MNRQFFKTQISVVLSIVALGFVSPEFAQAQFRDWNTRGGNWSNAGNWNPNLLPGATEVARIGNLPEAHTADVQLDMNALVAGLEIRNGMRLQTNGHNMAASLDTLITGSSTGSSELQVEYSISWDLKVENCQSIYPDALMFVENASDEDIE